MLILKIDTCLCDKKLPLESFFLNCVKTKISLKGTVQRDWLG
jgi:hypothetical protein